MPEASSEPVPQHEPSLRRRLAAEALGSAALLAVEIGRAHV